MGNGAENRRHPILQVRLFTGPLSRPGFDGELSSGLSLRVEDSRTEASFPEELEGRRCLAFRRSPMGRFLSSPLFSMKGSVPLSHYGIGRLPFFSPGTFAR